MGWGGVIGWTLYRAVSNRSHGDSIRLAAADTRAPVFVCLIPSSLWLIVCRHLNTFTQDPTYRHLNTVTQDATYRDLNTVTQDATLTQLTKMASTATLARLPRMPP